MIPATSGIYVLETPNGSQYVGSSINMSRRTTEHLVKAKKGTHYNPRLRAAAPKLSARVLLFCEPHMLRFYEQKVIDGMRPALNMSDNARGPTNFTQTHIANLVKSHTGKISGLRGIPRPPHVRAKLSAALKGRPRSLEAIAKHRATCAAKRAALGLS